MRRLNIGCGRDLRPGFDNADINKNIEGLAFCCDITDIPVEDNTYDTVYALHVIEHVPISKARCALGEWRRVLKPGGILRIDTPNFARTADLYLNGGWQRDFSQLLPTEQEYCSLNGTPSKMLWACFKAFSSPNPYDTHYANYDEELLSDMLHLSGFVDILTLQLDPSLMVECVAKK